MFRKNTFQTNNLILDDEFEDVETSVAAEPSAINDPELQAVLDAMHHTSGLSDQYIVERWRDFCGRHRFDNMTFETKVVLFEAVLVGTLQGLTQSDIESTRHSELVGEIRELKHALRDVKTAIEESSAVGQATKFATHHPFLAGMFGAWLFGKASGK